MKKIFNFSSLSLAVFGCLFFLCSTLNSHAQQVSPRIEDTEDTVSDYREPKHLYDSSERFFNERYFDEPFRIEKNSGTSLSFSKIDSLKSEKDFWYVNAIEKYKEKQRAYLENYGEGRKGGSESIEEPGGIVIGRGLQRIILIASIVIFLAAIVYFLMSNKVGFFAPRNKKFDDENDELEIGDNIFTLHYQELLNKALKENNYRLATRILFLQTLKLLSENNIIQFSADTTNIQYLIQLRGTAYYDDFFKVTRHYEYVWYGKFDIAKNTYDIISNDFSTMQKRIIPSYD